MLGPVGRAWKNWRDRVRLVRPFRCGQPRLLLAPDLRFPELAEVAKAGPELEPYQGLAEVWEEYVSAKLPDYAPFLKALALRRGTPLQSVLDLACGTGILMARLASKFGEVVGLDRSEQMLTIARRRFGGLTRLSFNRGDFCDFALGRQFDAVVCSSNSLNYVSDRNELGRVFAAVSDHLRPGGLFVFDVTPARFMRFLSNRYLHCPIKTQRFAIHFTYDANQRKETSKVILASGVETHHRIPLGPADVVAAAEGTNLEVEDYFSSTFLPRDWGHGRFYFFVLSKRG